MTVHYIDEGRYRRLSSVLDTDDVTLLTYVGRTSAFETTTQPFDECILVVSSTGVSNTTIDHRPIATVVVFDAASLNVLIFVICVLQLPVRLLLVFCWISD